MSHSYAFLWSVECHLSFISEFITFWRHFSYTFLILSQIHSLIYSRIHSLIHSVYILNSLIVQILQIVILGQELTGALLQQVLLHVELTVPRLQCLGANCLTLLTNSRILSLFSYILYLYSLLFSSILFYYLSLSLSSLLSILLSFSTFNVSPRALWVSRR